MSKTKRVRPHEVIAQSGAGRGVQHSPELVVLGLALCGMLLTGYLTYVALRGGTPAFCSAESACDLIQHSRWSSLLGLPLALWGFVVYGLLAANAWRLPARLVRWRRLWLLAWFGLAVSLYMTLVAWLQLDAFCTWCLLSLALMAAIFIRVSVKRPKSAPGTEWRHWLTYCGVATLVTLGGLQLYYSDMLAPREDPQLQALASHLQRSGAKFYGTFWCPTCQEQKRLFGTSAERLPFVECTPDGRNGLVARACIEEKINRYPTWIIREQRYSQMLTIEELTRLSRFKWRETPAP
ncbi:vitamin K epoxide reductase family protein [Pseudomonas sp. MMS21-TM103]|uniref:vitamin K epoxide reductase family protein n=1 Tax=Pseudomonas sp. MMS21 TM103 TaxID=2886506 RepID=UPI001EDE43E2|nr:vitamin K epoxide reductase family protein [Pseudomonas sp. MMS21 TM103]MCG4455902.1 vitamin K epoxide reductase family protein [Pseudomonas sp. MMS21 TM103]